MKTQLKLFFGLAALILAGAMFAIAQQPPQGAPPPPPPFFGERMAQDLNLTDDQKAKIKAIMDAERSTVEPLMKQAHDLHQQIEAATANGQFDEAKITPLAAQLGQVTASLTVEHERMKAKIYNTVLTSDQQAKLQQLIANHKADGRPPFGAPMPPPPPQN